MELRYIQGTASEEEIDAHLTKCNEDFVPHLEKKVSIPAYSRKISHAATTFEAWDGDTLIGLVAVYFNDPKGQEGYITSVSSIRAYTRKGIASKLLHMSIEHARQHGFKAIYLEVAKANVLAAQLYKSFQFQACEDRRSTMLLKYDV